MSKKCREAMRRRTRSSGHRCWRSSRAPSRLRPLAGIQGGAGGEEGVVRSAGRCGRGPTGASRRSRLAWRFAACSVHAGAAVRRGLGFEVDVAYPEGNRALRHAELVGDVQQRPRFGSQLSSPLLFDDLPAIAHRTIIPTRCDSLSTCASQQGSWSVSPSGTTSAAKAGRERYEQIEEWLDRVRGTDTTATSSSRLEQLYEQGRMGSEPLLDLRTMEFDEPTA